MLSIIRHGTRITLKLTGRIEGSSAEDLRMAVCPPSALDIDLTRVTAVDQDGERALAWLRDRGARFQGEGTFARRIRDGSIYLQVSVTLRYMKRPRNKLAEKMMGIRTMGSSPNRRWPEKHDRAISHWRS